MKYLYTFFLIFINMVFLVDFITTHRQFYPNLPMGEFHVSIKFILKCNVTTTNDIMYNLKINKKSSSSTEFLGNITYKIPFDDSISVNLNWAVKDLIGGWKDNAHILSIVKACTGLKAAMKNLWPKLVNAFGFSMNCAISPGNYISKGFDLSNITSKNIGISSFFYGSYKICVTFSDKYNNNLGCFITVCDVKRPWETE